MNQIPNTSLYYVEVPKELKKFLKIKFDFHGNYMLESNCNNFKLKIPFDFKILGTIDSEECNINIDLSEHGMLNNQYAFRRLLSHHKIEIKEKLLIIEKN